MMQPIDVERLHVMVETKLAEVFEVVLENARRCGLSESELSDYREVCTCFALISTYKALPSMDNSIEYY